MWTATISIRFVHAIHTEPRTWGWGPSIQFHRFQPHVVPCVSQQPIDETKRVAAWNGGHQERFFHFYIFQKKYRNIFSISQFTGLYPCRPRAVGAYVIKISILSHGDPYRPAGGLPPGRGRQAQYKSRGPPTPAFAANNIHREKKERRGVREGVATAKPCRILDPTAGNQYFSTLSF